MQEAQRIAAKAEKENPRKRPRRYTGKSKRTLKRHKKRGDDLREQGYFGVFEFLAIKEKANAEKRARESEQASDETASKDPNADIILVSECVDLVCRKEVLMHRD